MTHVYTVSEQDKDRLREPLGTVLEGEDVIAAVRERDYHRLITVGDRVSTDFAKAGIHPDIAIVDGKIEREHAGIAFDEIFSPAIMLRADNPAGGITETAWNTVREAVSYTCPSLLRVDGEEDLLALPAFLFASRDSLVVYGHWKHGAVVVEPGAEREALVRDLVGIPRFDHVLVGGSWDAFHAGHRYLLLAAFENGQDITIGVASDTMLSDKLDGATHDTFEERRTAVERFVANAGWEDRTELVEIDDFRGPALETGEALIVTRDTFSNAKRINKERLKHGTMPLKVAVLDEIAAQDGGELSSSRIRAGDIDHNGIVLKQ